MPKKKKESTDWVITKGQLSRWQKDQRKRRQFLVAGGSIIAIVVILIGIAIWDSVRPESATLLGIEIRPDRPAVAAGTTLQLNAVKVYDDGDEKAITAPLTWTSSGTQTATIDEQTGLLTTLAEGVTSVIVLTDDGKSAATSVAVAPPAILQVNDTSFDIDYYVKMVQLNPNLSRDNPSMNSFWAQMTLTSMTNQEIVRQSASDLGIAVTEEDIDAEIRRQITGLSSPDLEESVYQEKYQQAMEGLEKTGISEADFRARVGGDLLEIKARDQIGESRVPEATEQVHVRGILIEAVSDPEDEAEPTAEEPEVMEDNESSAEPEATGEGAEETADTEEPTNPDPGNVRAAILARLDAGEDFAAIAQEMSQHNSSTEGGDLGWMPEGIASSEFTDAFAEAAFSLEPETLSEPIAEFDFEGNTRYWLIEVIEKEDSRAIEDADRQQLENNAYGDWLEEQREQFTIVDSSSTELQGWAAEKALMLNLRGLG